MLLKSADDKTREIRALEELLTRPEIDARRRRDVQEEIWSIRRGVKAEAEAAYQLDFDLADSKHWAVIHDLRIELDDRVAQIDHLVISRLLEVFVCESKSYTGGVKVNDHGEWSTYRDRRPVGIPSPVEQNRRHIAVLDEVVKRGHVRLPRRIVALRPTFKNIVLVSPAGLITRPRRKISDLDAVVKVDQFRTHLLNRDIQDRQILKLVGLTRSRTSDVNSSRSTGQRKSIGQPSSNYLRQRHLDRRRRHDARGASSATARVRTAAKC